MNAPATFADFADDLDGVFLPAPAAPLVITDAENDEQVAVERTYAENCAKCGGSGKVRIGYAYPREVACFTCKGKGIIARKHSPEVRAANRDKAAARKAREVERNWADFSNRNVDASAWIVAASARGFEFAAAMREAVEKYGDLTERQMAAVDKCIASDKARTERKAAEATARAEREAAAPAVDAGRILETLTTAKANGLQFPKLRLAGFVFSLAPASGRNAGAVYAKAGDLYLGKVSGGKFLASRDCDDETRERIMQAAADPEAAATAYGKATGICGCCGRELTDPVSIARGIGPICLGKFGF